MFQVKQVIKNHDRVSKKLLLISSLLNTVKNCVTFVLHRYCVFFKKCAYLHVTVSSGVREILE